MNRSDILNVIDARMDSMRESVLMTLNGVMYEKRAVTNDDCELAGKHLKYIKDLKSLRSIIFNYSVPEYGTAECVFLLEIIGNMLKREKETS